MTRRKLLRPALTLLLLAVAAAWVRPTPPPPATADASSSCRFAIRASNDLSFDVWVDLYDSEVSRTFRFGVFGGGRIQLKIQNQRIRRGEQMDRRYTAPGKCSADRNWWIKVRRGRTQHTVKLKTGGTSSTSRTVDLGPASDWEYID